MEERARQRPELLVIAGPTASGKTGIAVDLALATGAELVGADSMQVYRRFDIGTAKPTPEELRGVRHHLIDVADPDESFDAARFVAEADAALRDIQSRDRPAILVGGTGLYIRTLLHGLQAAPPPNPQIRAQIVARAEEMGWPAMHKELKDRDPETGARLHENDSVRILRALEVLAATGRSMTEWQKEHGFASWRYRARILGLARPRKELVKRIEIRVDEMMDAGFLNEVKWLLDAGYGPELKPMQSLGYRRLASHLMGECTLKEAVDGTKADTRRFSKRQMTWFRREEGLCWVEPDSTTIEAIARDFWRLK